jgi:hypothetical protein
MTLLKHMPIAIGGIVDTRVSWRFDGGSLVAQTEANSK